MKDALTSFALQVDPNAVGIPAIDLNDAALADILGGVFIVVGALAVLFLLIGAVRYTTSAGDQNAIKQAKNTILYAIIGIIVSSAAFTVVQFTLGKLSGSI